MKKILMLSLGICSSASALAEQGFCGYRDYFHLSNNTPSSLFVISAISNSDISVQIVGPRGFELRDTPRCVSGFAQVTVAADVNRYCILEIKDGPYMSNPTISASCNHMTYKGISYDGINSYSYSLSFDL